MKLIKTTCIVFLAFFAIASACSPNKEDNQGDNLNNNDYAVANRQAEIKTDTTYGVAYNEIYFGSNILTQNIDTIFGKAYVIRGVFHRNLLAGLILSCQESIYWNSVNTSVTSAKIIRDNRELTSKEKRQLEKQKRDRQIEEYRYNQFLENNKYFNLIKRTLDEKYKGTKAYKNDFLNYFGIWDENDMPINYNHFGSLKFDLEIHHKWEDPNKVILLGIHEKGTRVKQDIVEKNYYPVLVYLNKKLYEEKKHSIEIEEKKILEEKQLQIKKDSKKF